MDKIRFLIYRYTLYKGNSELSYLYALLPPDMPLLLDGQREFDIGSFTPDILYHYFNYIKMFSKR